MTRLKPIAGLALAAIAAVVVGWRSNLAQDRSRDPLAAKRAGAERALYYRLLPGQPIRFPMTAGEDRVKLITHVALAPAAYDPTRRVEYSVTVRLRPPDGGDILWQHTLFTDSRLSKASPRDGAWLEENAFVDDGSIDLTDDRVLIVELPGDVAEGALLEVENTGQVDEILARAYRYRPRSATARDRAEAVKETGEKRAMIADSTFLPWSFLSAAERDAHLRQRYQRVSALGERGVDYQLRSMYYTGFRLPPAAAEAPTGDRLSRGRSVAYNLVGPGRVTVAVARPPGTGGDSQVDIRLFGPAMPTRADWVAFDPGATRAGRALELAPGLQTLTLATADDGELTVHVTGAPTAPVTYFHADDPGAHLRPDRRRIPQWLTAGDDEPVTARLEHGGDAPGVVRIDVRLVGAAGDRLAPERATVDIELVGDSGPPTRRTREVRSVHAPFESLAVGDGRAPVSEPVSIRLAPGAARELRVRASAPVALRFYSFLPGATRYDPAYDDRDTGEFAWRYAPLASRSWYPFRPANHRQLADSGRRQLLDSQVRLQRRGRVRPAGRTGHAVAVAPLGAPERQIVVEPVPAWQREDIVARWPGGAATRLVPATAMTAVFDRRSPGRATIHYRAAPEAVGAAVRIAVDGAATDDRVLSTRGRWRLPALAAGRHRIRVDAPAGIELWLDKPPAAGDPSELLRRRTVYALGPGDLRVRVTRPGDRAVAVNAVLYHPSALARPEIPLRAVIGSGRPDRVEEAEVPSVTRAVRVRTLPATNRNYVARFLDLGGAPAGYPRTIAVPIGEDLAAGAHVVTLSNASGRRLWARFFMTRREPETGERVLQWKLAD